MLPSVSRRRVLTQLGALSVPGWLGRSSFASEPLEISRVRFTDAPATCIAPQYLAEDLLRAEGFTEVEYVEALSGTPSILMLARDQADFALDFASAFIVPIDAGEPIKVLAGMHVGCYELMAGAQVASVLDLKGKRVGVGENLKSDPFLFVSAMASYVGLDPLKDIDWVLSKDQPMQLFLAGKVDAFLGFGTEIQELRETGMGHSIVSGALDRPWSQYFCCVIGASGDYVDKHPGATKRVMRALFTAADLCTKEPEKGAEILVKRGYAANYDHALKALKEINYATWREYDPADTLRFFALRLRENGMIQSSPEDLLSKAADWRFLEELRREI
jgi:NitT/TauT family transport system substrate-binding protein